MNAVVADTHALIWYILEPERLSDSAITIFDQVIDSQGIVYLSAISMVEICYLIDKGRLSETVLSRVMAAIASEDSGISIVAVDLAIGITVRQIERDIVPDMPDRIIAATAYHLDLPLITRDRKIQNSKIETIW